jgi:uncharacterized protein YhaN
MKILELDLRAFGRFTGHRLDFDRNGRNLHIIYGDNEAGKSTALRAVEALLYGVPERTTDGFLHDNKDLRIGARIASPDGRELTVQRRKGRKDTLLDSAGKPMADGMFEAFLAGVTQEEFGTRFGFDFHAVRRGGDDLLEGKGDLARSLFEAGTGILGLNQVLTQLEDEYKALFSPTGRNPKVNAAISAYREARGNIKDRSCTASRHHGLTAALTRQQAERDAVQREYLAKQGEKRRLERLSRALRDANLRRETSHRLQALADAVELPETAADERKAAQRNMAAAETARGKCQAELEETDRKLVETEVPAALLDRAPEIEALTQRLDAYAEAQRDLPGVREQHGAGREQARDLLRAIRPGLPLDRIDEVRLPRDREVEIKSMAKEHQNLAVLLKTAEARAEEAERNLKAATAALAATQKPGPVDELQRVVARVQKAGPLEQTLADQWAELRGLQAAAVADLQALPLFSGSLEDLETLAVPGPETCSRFAVDQGKQKTDSEVFRSRVREAEERLERLDRRIQAPELRDVPTEDALAGARERRDLGWQLVRQAWLDGDPNADAEREFDPERPLPEAFERAVGAADEVADRLRADAKRAGELARLQKDRDEARQALESLQDEGAALDGRREALQEAWRAAWLQAGIAPLPPDEMRGWLGRRAALIDQAREIRRRGGQAQQQVGRVQELRAELAEVLPPELLSSPGAPRPLEAELARAEDRLKELTHAQRRFEEARDEVDRRVKEANNSRAALEKARGQVANWQDRWERAVAALGLSQTPTPDAALAVLETLTSLLATVAESTKLQERIEKMEAYSADFARKAEQLAAVVGLDEPEPAPDRRARRLNARLNEARQKETLRRTQERRREQLLKEIRDHQASITGAREVLARLLATARCADLEALEVAEQRSLEKRKAKDLLGEIDQRLMGHVGGGTLAQLLQDLDEIVPDQLPAEIEVLESDIAGLEERRDVLSEAVGIAEAELRSITGGDAAAAAQDEAQSLLAAIRAGAEQYVRLRLAADLLRRAMERYRERNQDPILIRADELFPRLTLNSFSGLETSYDEKDQPVLRGVRPSRERVWVAGMSDGTRDQLYLALRLASLEHHLEAREAFPLVLDDILINFDDARARAALEVLAELSAHTQVLFFTHHHRLVELAENTPAIASRLAVHQLAESAGEPG